MENIYESELKIVERAEIDKRKTQVAFIGTFGSGKSTLINALSKKNLLGTSIHGVGVIAKISFGAYEEVAAIYYHNYGTEEQQKVESILVNELSEKLRITLEMDECNDIDHVEFILTESLFNNKVQFVDLPSGSICASDDNKHEKFLKKADAVVFVFNSTQALSHREKDYINTRFVNRQLKNIFFAITRYEAIPPEGQARFKEYILSQLHNVFIDRDGNFDDKLYKERVFFVDAHSALCVRTGQPVIVHVGSRSIEVDMTDEETGVLGFEKALQEYIEWMV